MTTQIKMPKRFDYSASSEFNDKLMSIFTEHGKGVKVLLDCVNMDYIDSAGIGLLVMAHKKALAVPATIALTNVKPSIKEILMLANLQKIVEIN